MDNVQEKAIVAYKNAGAGERAMLKDIFGEIFDYSSYSDLNSMDDVLKVLGRSREDAFPEAWVALSTPDEIAYRTIKLWVEANNKVMNWKVKWHDKNQRKYQVWVEVILTANRHDKGMGLGLSLVVVLSYCTGTTVGSRLLVGTEAEYRHIFKCIQSTFEDFFLK